MKLANLAFVAIVATGSAVAATWAVRAQSSQTTPPGLEHAMPGTHQHMPGMMPHDGQPAMQANPVSSDDTRELVRLPTQMQEHMLGNMRDHLATLNTVI